MRYLRYAILAAIAVCLVTVALANRGPVTLQLLPQEVATLLGYPQSLNAITLPLFLVIFLGLLSGVLLGFVWEWLREHKHRADASTQRREKERLAREVKRLNKDKAKGDDVLALLEDGGSAR